MSTVLYTEISVDEMFPIVDILAESPQMLGAPGATSESLQEVTGATSESLREVTGATSESLQEVRRHLARGNHSVSVRNRVEHFWFSVVAVLKLQNGGHITAPVAVIWSRPHGNQGVVEHVLVSFVNQLMRTTYQLEIVDRHEFFGDLCSKEPSSSPGTDGPTVNFFWIAPDQIAERSFVRDFLIPLDKSNLIQRSNIWGEPPVDTKNLQYSQWTLVTI